MSHTRDWNESLPAGSDVISHGDDEIRATKLDIRERMAVDHIWNDSTTTDGYHKKVTLKEQSSDPTTLTDYGILYTKDVNGITELFYKDSSGNIKQLTTGGKLNVSATEAVLLTEDQTIAGIKTFSAGQKTDTISENTTDSGVTIDGCLIKDGKAADSDKLDGYDYNSTSIKPFGSWTSKSVNTVYHADTDGFVVCCGYVGTEGWVKGFTDSSNPPTTQRAYQGWLGTGFVYINFCMPVRKGDYWEVTTSNANIYNLNWLPCGV